MFADALEDLPNTVVLEQFVELPSWATSRLKYAPIAALIAAVVIPEADLATRAKLAAELRVAVQLRITPSEFQLP